MLIFCFILYISNYNSTLLNYLFDLFSQVPIYQTLICNSPPPPHTNPPTHKYHPSNFTYYSLIFKLLLGGRRLHRMSASQLGLFVLTRTISLIRRCFVYRWIVDVEEPKVKYFEWVRMKIWTKTFSVLTLCWGCWYRRETSTIRTLVEGVIVLSNERPITFLHFTIYFCQTIMPFRNIFF